MYSILPHTADVRLIVTAPDMQALFRSALQGMSHIQRKGFCAEVKSKPGVTAHVDIKSADSTALLIDFLSEVLTLSHIHKAIFCEVRFVAFSEAMLTASIDGYPVDDYDEDIKAVTHHEAAVIRNNQQDFGTIIVFDI